MRTEETDAPDFRRLLRERGKRRREEHAGECANERPSLHHWITSSARSSSDCGTARPSAFAVLRLITSELGRLLDRQVGGVRALEDLVDESGGAAEHRRLNWCIRHE